MATKPPPLAKREEKHREEILDLIEEEWRAEEWATHIPKIIYEILLRNLFETRAPQAAWTDRAADGIQWTHMEEIEKALTDRFKAVRKLSSKKRKIQVGTRDRSIGSKQLEFECQLKTTTPCRLQELLKLRVSLSHNLFQSLIASQDLRDYGKTCGQITKLQRRADGAEHTQLR